MSIYLSLPPLRTRQSVSLYSHTSKQHGFQKGQAIRWWRGSKAYVHFLLTRISSRPEVGDLVQNCPITRPYCWEAGGGNLGGELPPSYFNVWLRPRILPPVAAAGQSPLFILFPFPLPLEERIQFGPSIHSLTSKRCSKPDLPNKHDQARPGQEEGREEGIDGASTNCISGGGREEDGRHPAGLPGTYALAPLIEWAGLECSYHLMPICGEKLQRSPD